MYSLFVFLFENSFLLRGCILFVVGLVIGSFINVVIYRLPIMIESRERKDALAILSMNNANDDNDINFKDFNLMVPSSHCRKCKQMVPIWANIPLFGYLMIKGKCVKCGHKISYIYPLIELISAFLFLFAGTLASTPYLLLAYIIFLSTILCLVVIDFFNLILPDELTLPLVWLGLLFNYDGAISGSLLNSVLGATLGYMSLWLIYWAFKLLTKRDGIGYGDFKLLAAILAWFGYKWFVPILLIAPFLGIIYYLTLAVVRKVSANQQVPFGSFLGIAAILVMFLNKYLILNFII